MKKQKRTGRFKVQVQHDRLSVAQKKRNIARMLAEEGITLSPQEQAEWNALAPLLSDDLYRKMLQDRQNYLTAQTMRETHGQAHAAQWLAERRERLWQ